MRGRQLYSLSILWSIHFKNGIRQGDGNIARHAVEHMEIDFAGDPIS